MMNDLRTNQLTDASVLEETTGIPQLLAISSGGSLYAQIDGKVEDPNIYQGMAVFNRSDPGSIAYAATTKGVKKNGQKYQQLFCSITSTDGEPSSRIFEFTHKPKGLGTDRDNQLFMSVSNFNSESLTAGVDISADNVKLIPLFVGPGSIALAPPLTEEEMATLGLTVDANIPWGNLLKGVLRSLPAIARIAYKIYEEVKNNDERPNNQKGAQPEAFGILGAVAGIALPFVGGLLKKILS